MRDKVIENKPISLLEAAIEAKRFWDSSEGVKIGIDLSDAISYSVFTDPVHTMTCDIEWSYPRPKSWKVYSRKTGIIHIED